MDDASLFAIQSSGAAAEKALSRLFPTRCTYRWRSLLRWQTKAARDSQNLRHAAGDGIALDKWVDVESRARTCNQQATKVILGSMNNKRCNCGSSLVRRETKLKSGAREIIVGCAQCLWLETERRTASGLLTRWQAPRPGNPQQPEIREAICTTCIDTESLPSPSSYLA
jgi:hypothetical protein